MTDYLSTRKSHKKGNSILQVFLNIVLALATVFITIVSENPLFGLILVFISKWRVFAVRWHYLWYNIRANLVDFIVGISIVLLAYAASSASIIFGIILAALYVVWLLFIKPMSTQDGAIIQAVIAVFLGCTIVSLLASTMNSVVMTFASALIGYATSRHILAQSGETRIDFLAIICALVFAEIAWLCHSWMIVYNFENIGMSVSQYAIIMSIITFVYTRIHQSIIKHDGVLKFSDVALPIVFGVFVVAMIVFGFSNPIFNI